MSEKMNFAINVLGKLQVATEAGTIQNVSISSVSLLDKDKEPFSYELREGETEDDRRYYAIVNLRLANEYLMERATEQFEAGDYDAAINNNLSIRVDADKASLYTRGALVNVTLDFVENADEELILVPTGISTPVMAKAKVSSFAEKAKALAEQRKAEKLAKKESENA